jgi:hypothetical protein
MSLDDLPSDEWNWPEEAELVSYQQNRPEMSIPAEKENTLAGGASMSPLLVPSL